MLKKSSELRKIQDLKGNDLGYIRVRNGVTTVVWLDAVRVVSMSFTGPASVIFGKIVVECDGRRIVAPKTIAQPLKETKKELCSYIDVLFRVEWTKVEIPFQPADFTWSPLRHVFNEMTIGTKVPQEVKWDLERVADKRNHIGYL